MRTNIDIDDDVLDAAMKGGSFKTKKDAVEAGLRLIARQAAYREILRWEGKLHWDGEALDGPPDAAAPGLAALPHAALSTGDGRPPPTVQAPAPPPFMPISTPAAATPSAAAKPRRHAGR